MSERKYKTPGSIRTAAEFKTHLEHLRISIPCETELDNRADSPLAQPFQLDDKTIGNRFCVQPMEGWDGTTCGAPTEYTFRRWRNFGLSGAKLIWGGEAVAVRHEGRANPKQLLINEKTKAELARLREAVVAGHHETDRRSDDLLIGLQLTHSGRYSCPNEINRHEPRILYHHPLLDQRVKVNDCYPLLTDGEIRSIIEDFHRATRLAQDIGFEFVDIKHCHGYLGHEFLSAYTRQGDYGGSFENRTRFLREVVEGVRAVAPGLKIGVRFSALDTIPFSPEVTPTSNGKLGVGIPDPYQKLLPYRWGFGVNTENPEQYDLSEVTSLLELFRALDIKLVNVSAGSPYYNPHIQRPALYPPSDGYQPPEDPLFGVARQLNATRELKKEFQDL